MGSHELDRAFCNAEYAQPGRTNHVDCKGVVISVMFGNKRVILGQWVQLIRDLIKSKGLHLTHVKAHVGIPSNEVANSNAQVCNESVTFSPMMSPMEPSQLTKEASRSVGKTPNTRQPALGIWSASFWA